MMYDIKEDPYQKNNIAEKDATLEKTLHNQLLEKLNEKKDPWLKRYLELNKSKN